MLFTVPFLLNFTTVLCVLGPSLSLSSQLCLSVSSPGSRVNTWGRAERQGCQRRRAALVLALHNKYQTVIIIDRRTEP